MNKTQQHFNPPQLRSMMIEAPNEVLIAGRGTGKTEGVGAPKTARQYLGTMPRGSGVILGTTFTQLLTRTLPGLIYGWEKLGYRRDVHYLIGAKPSIKWIKQWNWQGPYRPPLSFQYYVSWWNGGGANLVSQDRPGSSNGITIDWIYGDEAKLLNEEKFRTELVPANRGIIPAFKNNHNHHGITLTTDMPVGTAGRWLLDYKKAMDLPAINQIYALQLAKFKLRHILQKQPKTYQRELNKQITVIDLELAELRRDLLYYHTASTIDNIHALGLNYIKQQLRDTTRFQFDTQILNMEPLKLEDGFYPDLDEEKHGYWSEDVDYLRNLDFDFDKIATLDCRKDRDLHPNGALHIALDYNRRIHPLVVAQTYANEIRILNALYVLYPDKLPEVLKMFATYYKPHQRKIVYYWHDHTAVGDQHQSRISEDVLKILTQYGWSVIPMYYGQAPGHETKYRMWGHLLSDYSKYKKKIRFNRENCNQLLISMYKTQAEQKKDGFGKNKKPEHDEKFPAEDAPHFGDACDMLVHGLLETNLDYADIKVARAVG